MIIEYRTKTDINGNNYGLRIDTERKTFDRNIWVDKSMTVITRKKMREMIEQLKSENYMEWLKA